MTTPKENPDRETQIHNAIAAQVINYKNHQGHFWFDPEQKLFQGSLQIGQDTLCYEGGIYEELVRDFINAVEDYLMGEGGVLCF